MAIAVIGSINMDITAYMERLPSPGETVSGTAYRLGLGGKGANQAVAARKLGSDVAFIGRLGTDAFADPVRAELKSYGVDPALVAPDPKGATGIAIINVGADGENAITIVSGSNMRLDQSDIERSKAVLEAARVLLLQCESPLATSFAAARIVKAKGGTVILDPAPVPKGGLPAEAWAAADMITPNEIETGMLLGWAPVGPDDALKAAKELRTKGIATAIVKIGAKGLAYASASEAGILPPFKVKAIDTVAAGDCFNGGLAHALDRGMPLPQALRFAAATGALSTTRRGAAVAAPSRDEVEALLAH